MAKYDLIARTVLEPLSNFDVSVHSRISIRSIAVSSSDTDYRTLIYIGTYSGSLLLLATKSESESKPAATPGDDDDSSGEISFMRGVSVGDSPVEARSAMVLSEIGKVIVLCDGSLLLADWPLDQQLRKLSIAKGVSAIERKSES